MIPEDARPNPSIAGHGELSRTLASVDVACDLWLEKRGLNKSGRVYMQETIHRSIRVAKAKRRERLTSLDEDPEEC